MKKTREMFTSVYIAYMCTFFCFYYHNNYIDIMQAKRAIYLLGAWVYVGCMLISYLKEGIKWKNIAQNERLNRNGMIWIGILISSWLISFSLSVNKAEAFWGRGAKCTGLLIYVTGVLAAYFIALNVRWNMTLTWLFLLGSTGVSLLQILNRWGIDPLGMYANLVEEESPIFISTIGQINYNASFNCLIIAILMVEFLQCREKLSLAIYGTVLFIVYGGAICCCSDSVYMCMAVIFILLWIYAMHYPEKWNRLAIEWILFDSALFGVWFCWSFVRTTRFWGITALLFQMRLHWGITVSIWTIIIIGALFVKRYAKGWKFFCIGAMAGIPVVLWKLLQKVGAQIIFASEIEWSGSRFTIWNKCLRLFRESSVMHKLFGYGFNNIYEALQSRNK